MMFAGPEQTEHPATNPIAIFSVPDVIFAPARYPKKTFREALVPSHPARSPMYMFLSPVEVFLPAS